MNVFLLKGPVHSGKTTALKEFCMGRLKTGGVLSPVINGKRHFFDIETKETFVMEAISSESNIIQTGKFVFSEAAFNRANNIIQSCISRKFELIVIDEIGPLELRGKGFAETLQHLLSLSLPNTNLLLVVRENIVDDVIHHFQLPAKNINVITIDKLATNIK